MPTSEPSDSSPLRPFKNFRLPRPLAERKKNGNETQQGKHAVFVALAANISIGGLKLIAGLIGRHSALLSEAMHSFADALNSGFLLIGLQKGSRAPDKTHPFGYGLETTLWAMLASIMMLLLAGWSMYLGVFRLMHPEPLHGYLLSIFVLLASVGMEMASVNVAAATVLSEKELTPEGGWFGKVLLAAKHVRSVVSPTTRFVFYEDTIALFGAIVALIAIAVSGLGQYFGWLSPVDVHVPDSIASILIGIMLLGLAIYLFLHNSRGLTGGAASPQVEQRIRDYVMSLNGVSQIHDLRTIDYGLSGIVVHMRVEVNPDIQVKDVDDLTERMRDRIQARVHNIKEVIIEVLADETNIAWSDQFYQLIEAGRIQGVLKPREELILRNIYDFTHAVVGDIMVPRTDVDCIEISSSLSELIDLIIQTGHTRIPAYEEDIDNMIGAIHAKEVFEHVRRQDWNVDLKTLVRDFDIYPENKPVSDLLEEFKRKKIQIAMVADEHGGFAGIVTIEDLLEEIVGEIWDEYDEDVSMVQQLSPTSLNLNGRLDIDQLNEEFNLHIPDEEFNTLGGFVFGLLGREPKEGDVVDFEDLTFTVLEMDGHRIDKVQLDSSTPLFSNLSPEETQYLPGATTLEEEHPRHP